MKKGKETARLSSDHLARAREELEASGSKIFYMKLTELSAAFGIDLNTLSYDELMMIFNPDNDENKSLSAWPKVTAFLRKKRKEDMSMFPEKYPAANIAVAERGVVRKPTKSEKPH